MRLANSIRAATFALLITTGAAGADNHPGYLQGKITGWSNKVFERNFTINPSYPKVARYYELTGSEMVYQIGCGPFQIGQTLDYRVDDKTIYIRPASGKEQICHIASYKVLAAARGGKPSTAAPPKTP